MELTRKQVLGLRKRVVIPTYSNGEAMLWELSKYGMLFTCGEHIKGVIFTTSESEDIAYIYEDRCVDWLASDSNYLVLPTWIVDSYASCVGLIRKFCYCADDGYALARSVVDSLSMYISRELMDFNHDLNCFCRGRGSTHGVDRNWQNHDFVATCYNALHGTLEQWVEEEGYETVKAEQSFLNSTLDGFESKIALCGFGAKFDFDTFEATYMGEVVQVDNEEK